MNRNDLAALRSYDAMLARGPEEPATATVTVDYNIEVRADFDLGAATMVLGGDAHFSSDVDDEGLRSVTGTTDMEDVTSNESAKAEFLDLLDSIPGVDMDDPDITVHGPEVEDLDPRDEF